MSMQIMTVLQFTGILAAYLLLIFLLPALIFYKKFRKQRFCVRVLIYFTIGNFYVMNLVFWLQIFHISNRITLTLGTIIPVILGVIRTYRLSPVEGGKNLLDYGAKLLEGTVGIKLLFYDIKENLKKLFLPLFKHLKKSLSLSLPDWILVTLAMAVILWMYGSNMLQSFGYGASDLPVHNYWINAMGDNNIFVAGIYPFGFHCVVYYLHTVFGIETFVLMRLFGVVQAFVIHISLLTFLCAVCKSKYCAYTAMAFYVLANLFNADVFKRYLSSLPQEFGMLFILPSGFFLFLFFRERKMEITELKKEQKSFRKSLVKKADKESNDSQESKISKKDKISKIIIALKTDHRRLEKDEKKEYRAYKKKLKKKDKLFKNKNWKSKSSIWLWLFAMNFAMTLEVHFYDTMIAGILCVGIAGGYFFRLLNRRYFWRVMAAGVISLFIAVLPMVVAFIGGTPLQGSLGWGMSVITGSMEKEKSDSVTDIEGVDGVWGTPEAISVPYNPDDPTQGMQVTEQETTVVNNEPFLKRMQEKFIRLFGYLQDSMHENVFKYGLSRETGLILFAIVGLNLAMGVFLLIFPWDRDYGASILSCAGALALMFLILISGKIGIPAIMDANRARIYIAFLFPVMIAFIVDSLINLVFFWMKRKWLVYTISFVTIAAGFMVLKHYDLQRVPYVFSEPPFESNENIICLTNILHENEDKTFTICSANDELRMVEDYGFHYEIITLLRKMQGANMDGNLVIPTPKVYFFIEKRPLDYTRHYAGSGQLVSEEGAKQPLPKGAGLGIYQGENRWIVMSHMYYWAKEFSRLYEREMKVYYETENFICYELEQNTYRLYDLSIDYGYNRISDTVTDGAIGIATDGAIGVATNGAIGVVTDGAMGVMTDETIGVVTDTP